MFKMLNNFVLILQSLQNTIRTHLSNILHIYWFKSNRKMQFYLKLLCCTALYNKKKIVDLSTDFPSRNGCIRAERKKYPHKSNSKVPNNWPCNWHTHNKWKQWTRFDEINWRKKRFHWNFSLMFICMSSSETILYTHPSRLLHLCYIVRLLLLLCLREKNRQKSLNLCLLLLFPLDSFLIPHRSDFFSPHKWLCKNRSLFYFSVKFHTNSLASAFIP